MRRFPLPLWAAVALVVLPAALGCNQRSRCATCADACPCDQPCPTGAAFTFVPPGSHAAGRSDASCHATTPTAGPVTDTHGVQAARPWASHQTVSHHHDSANETPGAVQTAGGGTVPDAVPGELQLVPYASEDGTAGGDKPAPSPGRQPQPAPACRGHAPDYTWVVGELDYLYSRKTWTVRYAALGEEDRHGGSVTLLDLGPTDNLRAGQVVRVEGRLLDPETRQASPSYRVQAIQLLAEPGARRPR